MDIISTDQITQMTGDQLDSFLEQIRTAESRLKAIQVEVVREVDRRQIPLGDGMRTLEDWMIGRMDLTRASARRLATVARADSSALDRLLSDGLSFDRVAELAAVGETDPHLELDLPGLRSTLDETSWNLWGTLPALEGKHIANTLDQIADDLPEPRHGHRESRATRRADALFVVCDRHNPDSEGSGSDAPGGSATVFVDATNRSTRPRAWLASGPRVGASTLERILCGSPIDVIALTEDGEPLRVGNATPAVPPSTRRFVLWRDGGMCTADGCASSYRLQPHHITERSDGGDHHHTNITSLCWFHHHVVVHGRGFGIDPASPTRRRRFLPPARSNSDPPL